MREATKQEPQRCTCSAVKFGRDYHVEPCPLALEDGQILFATGGLTIKQPEYTCRQCSYTGTEFLTLSGGTYDFPQICVRCLGALAKRAAIIGDPVGDDDV